MKTISKYLFRLLVKLFSKARYIPQLVGSHVDFFRFCSNIGAYKHLISTMPFGDQGGLLIVSGRGMNLIWAQLWTLMSISARAKRLKPYVLTTRAQDHLNRYYRLLNIELLYFEELVQQVIISFPPAFSIQLDNAKSFDDFRALVINRMPIGDIALSTYCRSIGTGLVVTDSQLVRDNLRHWIFLIYQAMTVATEVYSRYNILVSFHTECFMEEYGGIYYAGLNAGIKIIRFAGTVRDDAFVILHGTWMQDRLHHASLSDRSWEIVKNHPSIHFIRNQLSQNFSDRYGNKWYRSKRNYQSTLISNPIEARVSLGLPASRKVAVIFSHILYDTIFFYGTDLFRDYATWLIETLRAAISNDKLDWFIKVHPSNIWRGELTSHLCGRYEEERLIADNFGTLPSHVHLIPANNNISPVAWMKLANYGITVRGTSGLEMAALGGTVITAGTGRYEKRGFTLDPSTKEEYLELLKCLPDIPEATLEQIELAQRYAYGIFILKPFTLSTVKPKLKSGKKSVVASDDLFYIPKRLASDKLPNDLSKFADFLLDDSCCELLQDEMHETEQILLEDSKNVFS